MYEGYPESNLSFGLARRGTGLAPPFWCPGVPSLSTHPAVIGCGLYCFCFVHREFFKMCAAIENPASSRGLRKRWWLTSRSCSNWGRDLGVKHVTCETKKQSMEWGHKSSHKRQRKCLQTLSARKIMATVFWGQGGYASGGFSRTWLNNKLREILWNNEKS